MMYCPECRAKIVQGDKFCRECGNNLTIIRTENICAGPDEQVHSPFGKDIFISEPPGNNTFSGTAMMGFMGMMNLFSSSGRIFSYSTQGMNSDSGLDYSISENDGKLYAKMRLPNHSVSDIRIFEIPDEIYDRITEVIDQFNGDRWNGFNGNAEGVKDGESFSFSYNNGKGRIIAASGYMSWPDDFGAAISVITGIMEDAFNALYQD
jgi:hypothetical protein